MRVEATIPDSRGAALGQLAEELGLSRSQIVDEALALFLKAILEVRRGRRLVTVDPKSSALACELATPTLAALEWAMTPGRIELSPEEFSRMQAAIEAPPEPNARLRAAAKRSRR